MTTYDSPTTDGIVDQVKVGCNPFGQATAEYQQHGGAVSTSTTPKVGYAYSDGSTNHARRLSITHPNGRVLHFGYDSGMDDSLGRVGFLADDAGGLPGQHLAEYRYLGSGSFVQTDYPEPALRCDLAHGTGDDPYAGFDQFGRVVDLRWWNTATNADVERTGHGYDRAGNRLWRENPVAPAGHDELYGYDRLNRLVDFKRGRLAEDKASLATLTIRQQWRLDATGNWTRFEQFDQSDAAKSLDQTRTHNAANELTAFGATVGQPWATPEHDRAGNMARIPSPWKGEGQGEGDSELLLTYDAWNRLVKVSDASTQTTVAEYAYDGRNYRTVAKSYSAGQLSETRHLFYSDQWQVLEERVNGVANADRQFVWGLRYVDDLVLRDRDANADGTLEERLYALQDPNWNVTALAGSDGSIVERYQYTAYGVPTFLTGSFAARTSSQYDMETLYCGYRWDKTLSAYHVRHRLLFPHLGQWNRRDPAGYRNGIDLYEYVHGNPVGLVDPTGLGYPEDISNDPSGYVVCVRWEVTALWICINRCQGMYANCPISGIYKELGKTPGRLVSYCSCDDFVRIAGIRWNPARCTCEHMA